MRVKDRGGGEKQAHWACDGRIGGRAQASLKPRLRRRGKQRLERVRAGLGGQRSRGNVLRACTQTRPGPEDVTVTAAATSPAGRRGGRMMPCMGGRSRRDRQGAAIGA